MRETPSSTAEIVTFLRRRDYRLDRELGQGACGKTVLLYDDQIDEKFVCKKFVPCSDAYRQDLYSGFVREIKLLHKLHHPNVVRVFNYYIYPEKYIGYILMEYVDGPDIQEFVKAKPEKTNELFIQAISGFDYLEKCEILHRDIRPGNLLVTAEGNLKIIDLGFGKHVQNSKEFEKSISPNWWCEIPEDFHGNRYDFCTEVYFVGKLFEKLIRESQIAQFQYLAVLRQMCERNPTRRIKTFAAIAQNIRNDQLTEISFSDADMTAYRAFADAVCGGIAKIARSTKYVDDIHRIEDGLNDILQKCMLEEYVFDTTTILQCILDGTYYFRRNYSFEVVTLRQFVVLVKSSIPRSSTNYSRQIAHASRYTSAYDPEPIDDDVPF